MFSRKDYALYAKWKKTNNFVKLKRTSYLGVYRNLKNCEKCDVAHGPRDGQCEAIVNFDYLEPMHIYLVMHRPIVLQLLITISHNSKSYLQGKSINQIKNLVYIFFALFIIIVFY